MPMNAFVDPRSAPDPQAGKPHVRTTTDLEELAKLHRLCREGRLYDVEDWIRTGRPLQATGGMPARRRYATTALKIALEREDHAMALLLLCNGYEPNLEPLCPLDLALRARRQDLIDMLLDWGADPHQVDLEDLFATYSSALFERFRALGVDLTAGHALADALAHHTSNKPLFGYAKRHREHDAKIRSELDIALVHHAGEGNEKGVQLCLWAGADPHTPARSLRYRSRDEEEDEDEVRHTAIEVACRGGHAAILERLGPDPARDDFDDLFCAAHNGAVIELLARSALPRNVATVIQHHLMWAAIDFRIHGYGKWRALDNIRRLFAAGARWTESTADAIAAMRRVLLKSSDDMFVDLMKLLAEDDHCAPEILVGLANAPNMRARMRKVGFIPPGKSDPHRYDRPRPTRAREVLSKFGIELPKPAKAAPHIPRTVYIGGRRPNCREIKLDRAMLFERVWAEPVAKLAEAWGISGPGLAKACRRLQIPVPPRGYWAKVQAGQRVRRPRLLKLPPGQADEIMIWEPA